MEYILDRLFGFIRKSDGYEKISSESIYITRISTFRNNWFEIYYFRKSTIFLEWMRFVVKISWREISIDFKNSFLKIILASLRLGVCQQSKWNLPLQNLFKPYFSYSDFQAYCRTKKNKTFICKPESGCQGRGIFLTKNPKDIKPGEHVICQQYITKVSLFLFSTFKSLFLSLILVSFNRRLQIWLPAVCSCNIMWSSSYFYLQRRLRTFCN